MTRFSRGYNIPLPPATAVKMEGEAHLIVDAHDVLDVVEG